MSAPELPEELVDSRDVEEADFRTRAQLREYGETLFEEQRQLRAAQEEEWRRIRIPVGIVWRDPRDMMGHCSSSDSEEQELLRAIRKMRRNRT